MLIHGPRQAGKTSLARMVGEPEQRTFLSLDDPAVPEFAVEDPMGFVANLPERVTLDEVQRAPGLFTSIKLAVDRERTPGRFLLTGSTNVLLLPSLSDSLAGRMAIVRLHPFSQAELAGGGTSLLERLLAGEVGPLQGRHLGAELAERVAAGGYPAALARKSVRGRQTWYADYVETLVQRDVRDVRQIRNLQVIPDLLQLLAGQTGRLINVADLAAPFQLSRPTIAEYVTLLERLFLMERLPPWFSNRLSRLIKGPKLHLGDTGLACALLGLDG